MAKNHDFRRKSLAVAVTAACVTAPVALHAQEESSGLMDEILVTATRRETSVQDIPYNISAMSGEYLERQNIVNQYDVLRAMHGITVVDRGYRNGGMVNSIVIRGLNVDNGQNGDIMLNAVPTVATYYDNTPLFASFLVKDVERVEVLRGPQGTLYGSGSLGGTVRYIGNRPDPEAFAAEVELDYGQTSGSEGNNLAVDAMVNIPLGDTTALRVNFSRIDNDGSIDYINAYQLNDFREPLINVNGTCVDPRAATDTEVLQNVGCFEEIEDADTVEIDYAKVSLRGEPSDKFNYQLSYQMQDDEIGARRSTTLGDNNQPSGDPLYFAYSDDDSGQVLLEPAERDVQMASLDLEWDLGFATFTSSTSTYDHEGMGESDNGGLWASGGEIDGTSRDWNFNFYGGGWPRPAQRAERGYDDEAFIQEFRLVSNESDGNLDWIVGAFYMDQDNSVYQLSYNPGMNEFYNACDDTGGPECAGFWPVTFYPGEQLSEIDFEYIRDTAYEEKAIYGELTYHVSDTVHLTGGFRWFDNETVNDVILGFPLLEGWTSPAAPQSTDSDDDVLVKLNASWDLNDSTMLYATYSEGYRHGGAQSLPDGDLIPPDPFGEPNAVNLRTFESDSVENYEFGVKGGTDKLLYTASLFHVDWDNPQLNTTSVVYGFYLAANGDTASTEGIELELEGYLADSVHYRVGYTYVDAQLDKDFISPQTGNLVAPKGSTLPGAPESVLSLSLDNTWEINGGLDLLAGVNLYYQSDSENFIDQASTLNETFDSFSLVNINATVAAENWSATLYVKNLTDEEAPTGGFANGYWSYDTGVFENWYGNGNRQFIVQPQTIGLKFGYRF
ncbi:MAG: TonB-dependent receptor [Gammaproteobacteria bacterium]|nr:TonB-dependent receptor [Gammaproteobacteria bacterium]MDH3750642.1 TonB-dependent receptor [Gammaproteobacteria bacterium]MDH3804916.1 TonB-dependent receptor [Gammaproteobacteria bacterium]